MEAAALMVTVKQRAELERMATSSSWAAGAGAQN
jgi:hypothetical protein